MTVTLMSVILNINSRDVILYFYLTIQLLFYRILIKKIVLNKNNNFFLNLVESNKLSIYMAAMEKGERVKVGYQKIIKQNKVYVWDKNDNVLKMKNYQVQPSKN